MTWIEIERKSFFSKFEN